MKQILNVVIGVVAGFLLAGVILLVVRIPGGNPVVLEPAPTQAPITVHVIGAVVRPGVYTFPEGSRVQDAVTAAGGLLAEAEPNQINLAAKLQDGQQLDIPGVGGSSNSTSGSTLGSVPPAAGPFTVITTPGAATNNADLVNINTATLDQLDTLPGIGPTTAQKIIDYRTQHGPFSNIEDIMNVSGIGPATFDNIKNLITTD